MFCEETNEFCSVSITRNPRQTLFQNLIGLLNPRAPSDSIPTALVIICDRIMTFIAISETGKSVKTKSSRRIIAEIDFLLR